MRLRSYLASAAAVTLAWAAPSMATTITITSAPYSPNSIFGGIKLVGPPSYNDGGEAGRFAITGTVVGSGASFNAFTYCVDIFKPVFTSQNYDISALSAIGGVGASASRQSLLAGLLVNSASLFSAATTDTERRLIAAATQVSVWELVYETAGAPLTVSSGNFSVFGDFTPAVATRANTYLSNNWTASAALVSSLISVTGQAQNQIYLNAPIPEPATWLSMVVGFAIVGGAVRRAKFRHAAIA
jgi:hypothetical protein